MNNSLELRAQLCSFHTQCTRNSTAPLLETHMNPSKEFQSRCGHLFCCREAQIADTCALECVVIHCGECDIASLLQPEWRPQSSLHFSTQLHKTISPRSISTRFQFRCALSQTEKAAPYQSDSQNHITASVQAGMPLPLSHAGMPRRSCCPSAQVSSALQIQCRCRCRWSARAS